MTIEEAIRHCKDEAGKIRIRAVKCANAYDRAGAESCHECAREHEQLAAWLEELQQRREQEQKKAEENHEINGRVLIGLARAAERMQGIQNALSAMNCEGEANAVQMCIDALLTIEPQYEAVEIAGARIVQQKWIPEQYREDAVRHAIRTLVRSIGEAAQDTGAVTTGSEPAAKTLDTAEPEDTKVWLSCAVIKKIKPQKEEQV